MTVICAQRPPIMCPLGRVHAPLRPPESPLSCWAHAASTRAAETCSRGVARAPGSVPSGCCPVAYTRHTPGIHPAYTRHTPGVHPAYTRHTPGIHPAYTRQTPGAPGAHPAHTRAAPRAFPRAMYAGPGLVHARSTRLRPPGGTFPARERPRKGWGTARDGRSNGKQTASCGGVFPSGEAERKSTLCVATSAAGCPQGSPVRLPPRELSAHG